MAQTKRKRQTKHRGNAAGSVTNRGRTSRPASPTSRKSQTKQQSRLDRLNKRPTWDGALKRAGILIVLMFAFVIITSHNIFVALLIALIALVIYVPAGYYFDLFLWRRRMAKQGLPNE